MASEGETGTQVLEAMAEDRAVAPLEESSSSRDDEAASSGDSFPATNGASKRFRNREEDATGQSSTDTYSMVEEKRDLMAKASGVAQKNAPATTALKPPPKSKRQPSSGDIPATRRPRGSYRPRASKTPSKRGLSNGDSGRASARAPNTTDLDEYELQVNFGVGQVGQPRGRRESNSLQYLEREKMEGNGGASAVARYSNNANSDHDDVSQTSTRASLTSAMIKEKEAYPSARSVVSTMSQEDCVQAPRPTMPGAVSVAGINGPSPEVDDWRNASLVSIGEYDSEMGLHGDAQSTAQSYMSEETIVVAHTVEEDLERKEAEIEEEIRRRILQEAVEADIVPVPLDLEPDKEKQQENHARSGSMVWIVIFAVVAVAGGIVIALIVTKGGNTDKPEALEFSDSESTGYDQMTTIDIIKQRGFVKCGTYDGRYGFGKLNDDMMNVGFNIDQCKAISIAVFGVPDKYEGVVVSSMNRLPLLAAGEIDVLTNTVTHTMGRDVWDPLSGTGFTFSAPYFYSGLAFGGVPEYVACAEALDSFNGQCRNLRICAGTDTTHEQFLYSLLPGTEIVPSDSPKTAAENMIDETCNVVASEPISMLVDRFREYGYEGPFRTGGKVFSKEPLALVTREEDTEWSNLVNFVVNVFFLAEAKGISKSNAEELMEVFMGNSYLGTVATGIVAHLGNYGDMYTKHLESLFPRRDLNTLHSGDDSGLLYALPFGLTDARGPEMENGTLAEIVNRGHVRCGVVTRSDFVHMDEDSVWSGLEIEFCRALSGAAFAGSPDSVEIVDLSDHPDGVYTALVSGEVDVVSGARVTLEADFKEPTTGQGFTFSTPFFYDSGNAFAFATTEDDTRWNDFCNWVVLGSLYAEEKGINSDSSVEMPVVRLFGEPMKQMLRDMVFAVGSYADMYNATLSEIPRSPTNHLNQWLSGPQQFPIPFR
ncbi:Putative amino-acid ABC transporter-binding protein YhdW [Seminavis robusta]|uniref:Amino-acid ABC transporter-binding protein YhdW n=1 Tax=Seminavis robusta TaxID=568900 RepID=A0A9N8ETX4_9STRA|nr:Putative amino-acid ABC transporter-binding protein YhdW [Seminavis robusta]|eukprot:Sro1561_g282570.1 Putative amino-acid ABC transporter-binding protein YhdW (935) ;mRNA; r:2428-5232